MLPDATILLDYMLNRYTNVLNNLVVYPQQMLNNINLTRGVIFAQRVMNKLINVGMSREQAYDTVQPIAMEAYNNNKDFRDLLVKNHEMLAKLSVKDIDSCFGLDYYFKNVDYIYKKVGLIK
jgi:adenylosuccinate lyase